MITAAVKGGYLQGCAWIMTQIIKEKRRKRL